MECEAKIGVVVALTVFTAIFVIICTLLYLKRHSFEKDIKLKRFLKTSFALGIVPKEKSHDILVHCCVEDSKWVKDILLYQLETELKRGCYLSYRDSCDLGKDVVDAIGDDIDAAANILIIISNKYLAYSWHAYYIKVAHRKSLMEDIPLVFLFLDDLRDICFPDWCQVQRYLLHHRLLQWKENAKEKTVNRFWKNMADKELIKRPKIIKKKDDVKRIKNKASVPCDDSYRISKPTVQEKSHFIYRDYAESEKNIMREKEWIRQEVNSEMLHDQIIVDITEDTESEPEKIEKSTCKQKCELHCPPESKHSRRSHGVSQKNRYQKSPLIMPELIEESDRDGYSENKDNEVETYDVNLETMTDRVEEERDTPVIEEVITKSTAERRPAVNIMAVLALLHQNHREISLDRQKDRLSGGQVGDISPVESVKVLMENEDIATTPSDISKDWSQMDVTFKQKADSTHRQAVVSLEEEVAVNKVQNNGTSQDSIEATEHRSSPESVHIFVEDTDTTADPSKLLENRGHVGVLVEEKRNSIKRQSEIPSEDVEAGYGTDIKELCQESEQVNRVSEMDYRFSVLELTGVSSGDQLA